MRLPDPWLARVNLLSLRLPNARSITLWSLLRHLDRERRVSDSTTWVFEKAAKPVTVATLTRLLAYGVAQREPPL